MARPTFGEPSDESRAEISDPLSLPWDPLPPNRHTESCMFCSETDRLGIEAVQAAW